MTPQAKEPSIAMMIDIETLALTPTAYVTQVGICVADVETREYLVEPVNYWTTDDQPPTATKDIKTIQWWMAQEPAAQRAVFLPPEGRRTDRGALFAEVTSMIDQYGCTVWGSPAMFDLPILTHYFGGKPWMYNVERDMMTLYKVIDPTGALRPPPNDLQHDAASDARWQMEYLFNLFARLKTYD